MYTLRLNILKTKPNNHTFFIGIKYKMIVYEQHYIKKMTPFTNSQFHFICHSNHSNSRFNFYLSRICFTFLKYILLIYKTAELFIFFYKVICTCRKCRNVALFIFRQGVSTGVVKIFDKNFNGQEEFYYFYYFTHNSGGLLYI